MYRFGASAPMPLKYYQAGSGEANFDADLLVIPRASSFPLTARLLVDKKTGSDAKCENAGYRAGNTPQSAEVFTPQAAWERMGRPDVAVNANFFDVRAGVYSTACTVQMGTYYDSHADNRSAGAGPNRFWPGTVGLSAGSNTMWESSTMFIQDSRPGQRFFIAEPISGYDSPAVRDTAYRLEREGKEYVAFSGGLLRGQWDFRVGQPAGELRPRTGIGYNRDLDEFYILQGRSMSVVHLQEALRAMGSTMALNVDGGGSSTFMVNKGAVKWAGATGGVAPRGTCEHIPNMYCTSRVNRAIPSYLGLRFQASPSAAPVIPGIPPQLAGSIPMPAGLGNMPFGSAQLPALPPLPGIPPLPGL